MTKKSLGQHWLKDKRVLKAISDTADLQPYDTVVEVGPGKGVLTEYLLPSAKRVIAIEKDRELVPYLKEKFATDIEANKLELIECDILSFNPDSLTQYHAGYKVVANIPYYITGAIIRLFLESQCQPSSMTLLIQKEVADRIVAHDGKESLLSLSVKTYGLPKKVLRVPARAFTPAPKVDSAVLHISDISKNFFTKNTINERDFFAMLHQAFNQKRKQLQNTLPFLSGHILGSRRPESLSLNEWLNVYQQKQLLG